MYGLCSLELKLSNNNLGKNEQNLQELTQGFKNLHLLRNLSIDLYYNNL